MGYLNQLFEIIFSGETKEEDYTSYESWYEVLEGYTYEELQELVDNYNLYSIGNVFLRGFRPTIDELAKFMSGNHYSCKYYKKR